MKKFEELTEAEEMLRALIYAAETRHEKHPDHPCNLGDAYLSHVLMRAKETAIKLGIPLVLEK